MSANPVAELRALLAKATPSYPAAYDVPLAKIALDHLPALLDVAEAAERNMGKGWREIKEALDRLHALTNVINQE